MAAIVVVVSADGFHSNYSFSIGTKVILLFDLMQVGASLYVSNIGSSSFMGIGGAASVNGIAVVCYEFTVSMSPNSRVCN